MGCEVKELNVQSDHIHLLVSMPPKESVPKLMGTVKGKTAIQIFRQFPYLKHKPYWGNHFWARGLWVKRNIDVHACRKHDKRNKSAPTKKDYAYTGVGIKLLFYERLY